MTMPISLRNILVTLTLFSMTPHASAQADDCEADLDACVQVLIAETATFVEECGKAFPQSKSDIDAAFQNWKVLKLSVPGIGEALDRKSRLRATMRVAIASYLKQIPDYEREIECGGRVEMMRNPEPQLRGDSARLPQNALSRYAK